MCTDHVDDLELLRWMQHEFKSVVTKSFMRCHRYIIPSVNNNVYIVAKGDKSHFNGLTRCSNKWVCPSCSARDMSNFASDLACAIEALKSEYAAIMITATVPHIKNESFDVVYKRLHSVWRKLIARRSSKRHIDGFSRFWRDCGVKYYAYAVETTYGVNGWHPHIHALFWVKRSKLRDVALYEDDMKSRFARFVQEDWRATYNDNRVLNVSNTNTICISKDKDGNIREQLSSMYVSGWQADHEISGNVQRKASNNGHMSIYQLTVAAYNGDNDAKSALRELCKSTIGKKRHCLSNGLPAVIRLYKQTQSYIKFIAQKKSDATTEIVFYFNFEQWCVICCEEFCRGISIKSTLLRLATQPNARRCIVDYLLEFGINVEDNLAHIDRFARDIA